MKEKVGEVTLKFCLVFIIICALIMIIASPVLAQSNNTALTQTPQVQTRPTIIGVSPNQGNQGQTLSVTVTGTNFTDATGVSFLIVTAAGKDLPGVSGASLRRDITATNFTVDSDTQITADIVIDDRAIVGLRFITVTGPSGEGILLDAFTVFNNAPIITNVSPNQINQGQTLSVTIDGTKFTGARGVSFGSGIIVTSFTVDSDTQITANIVIADRAPVGLRFVTVTGPSGKGVLPDGFIVFNNAPITTSVSPNQCNQGQKLSVTVDGTNFTSAKGVSFGSGIIVTSFTVGSDTQITANIVIADRALVGLRFVTVTGPSGKGVLPGGFIVFNNIPIITSVSPNQGNQGQTLSVTIAGTKFSGTKGVSFGAGILVTSFTVDNDTQITANVVIAERAFIGLRSVTVTNPSGKGILQTGFSVTKSEQIP
jgi:hypothetical protein